MNVDNYLAANGGVVADLFSAIHEIEPDKSKAIAIVEAIRKRFAGDVVYIPFGNSDARNAEIKTRFNGRNHRELAQAYRLSLRAIYRIVNK